MSKVRNLFDRERIRERIPSLLSDWLRQIKSAPICHVICLSQSESREGIHSWICSRENPLPNPLPRESAPICHVICFSQSDLLKSLIYSWQIDQMCHKSLISCYLWILQEGSVVFVSAASVLVRAPRPVGPGAVRYTFSPSLLQRKERSVHEVTDVYSSEVVCEIIERHPGNNNGYKLLILNCTQSTRFDFNITQKKKQRFNKLWHTRTLLLVRKWFPFYPWSLADRSLHSSELQNVWNNLI